ncbi:MAG: hypothetical protein EA398_01935 [Deltaproteobacteria bacterium]|nr:MAG: hypothetical protein EA398_01935 [Deltaproteobacteria bacterium]
MVSSLPRRGLLVAAALVLAACSGSSGSSADSTDPSGTSSGSVPGDSSADATVPGSDVSGASSAPSDPDRPPECPDDGLLRNLVPASPLVTRRSGLEAYRYVADVQGTGLAELELLGAGDAQFGTLTVRQLLGGEDDGTMEGVLSPTDGAELRLQTRGTDLSATGYTVITRIERPGEEDAWVELEARFETVRCWSADQTGDGLPCTGVLPGLDPDVPLPGCGLITDERIHAGAPAELVALAWRAPAAEDAPAAGIVKRGEERLAQLDVLAGGAVTPAAEREAWIDEHDAALLGDPDTEVLLHAWLDRAWWRTLEHHVAHCDVTLLEQPDGPAAKSRCPGDHRSDAWGSPAGSRRAGVFGDPNFVTLDGHAWAFHATGEYVLAEATDGEPFVLHGRFEPVLVVPVPECLGVSLSTGLAALLDGHRVTVLQGPPFQVWINDTLLESADQIPDLADGHELSILLDRVRLRWPGGEEVTASAGPELLTVTVELPDARRGNVRGLLGQFDGRPGNDHVLPDGTVLPQPLSFETMYDVLGPAWRLDATSTLFHHGPGEGPDDFHIPGFPEAPVRVAHLPADRVAAAEPVCDAQGITDPHLRDACILDVVCMDDPDVAASTAAAPTPTSSQPPGHHDVALFGDARLGATPESLGTDTIPRDACAPEPPPTMTLFPEREDVDLEDDLDVDLGAPGSLREGHDGTASLATGTRVRTWTLHRPTPAADGAARILNATVRFDQPVLGVLADGDRLANTDGLLGHPDTHYGQAASGGLHDPDDRVLLEPDRRTLRITWTGDAPHRIRILVEAP